MRRPVNVPVLYGQCQAKGFDHIKQGIKCWFAIRRLKKWHISEKHLQVCVLTCALNMVLQQGGV